LAVGIVSGKIRIWDVHANQQIKEIKAHEKSVIAMALTRDGRHLASASVDGTIMLWDTKWWLDEGHWNQGDNRPLSMAFSPDGKLLAVACWSGEVIFYNVSRSAKNMTLKGDLLRTTLAYWAHDLPVTAIAFTSDGEKLVSASLDGTVKIWIDLPNSKRP
jgi:WD40 repeat protein